MEKQSSENKRSDLQGVRGLAILSVLGFHFLPSIFPNGYLGVDQFFVLSGFLMCKLLRRSSKSSTIWFFFNFYSKRLKRILPLYQLVIFVSLIALCFFFPETAYETNLESSKRALLFVSNRQHTEAEDYFALLSLAVDIFTHTWSLSVEIQFYLIVPFLFLFGNGIVPEKLQMLYYGVLGLASYGYSLIFCSETIAFNSVFARIWQFMIGMIVYVYTEREAPVSEVEKVPLIGIEECSLSKSPCEREYLLENSSSVVVSENDTLRNTSEIAFKVISLSSMIGFVICPFEVSSLFLRPFFTIATGILMMFSESDTFLSFRFLTYIGDISYSLYLLHWPIYAFWKLQLSSGNIWNYYLLLAFALSLVFAVFSYECYEKWYLKLSGKSVALLCSLLLFMNVTAIYHDQIHRWIVPKTARNIPRLDGIVKGNVSFEEARKLNSEWSVHDYRNTYVPTCQYEEKHGPFGRCNHEGLNETTGKYKIMIIGNSFAAHHARLVYQECGSKAKQLLQIAISACEPLYPYKKYGQRCIDNVKMFERIMPEEKPDYLFLTSRFLDIGDPFPNGVNRVEDDPIYLAMKKTFDIIVKSVKFKVFVFMQIPEIVPTMIEKIVDTIQNKGNLQEFDRSFVSRNHTMARIRYKKMVEGCKKCVPFDYDALLWNKTTSTWRFYDEANSGLSYMTSINHLSFHGLELVRHIFSNLCRSIY